MSNSVHEVVFLPWADIKNDLTIGPFQIWPWNKSRVTDAAITTYLDKYFKSHVDRYGKPVPSITILSIDETFSPISQTLMREARIAADILLFSVIFPGVKAAVRNDTRNMAPPTGDCFQLVKQRFNPGDTSFAVHVGGSIHAGQIGKLKVTCPWNLGGIGFPDKDVLQGLGRLFGRKVKTDVRVRISRSLEWFRLAHISGDDASALTKVVMMATAFEVLFSLPMQQKTRTFIEKVRSRMDRTETPITTRADSIGKNRTHSLPGWWADDFYDLRSRVVHGDPVKVSRLKYKHWLTHLIVADLVFDECLTSELYDLKLFGNDIRRHSRQYDQLCPNKPSGWYEQDLKDWLLGYTETHQRLGWLPKSKR